MRKIYQIIIAIFCPVLMGSGIGILISPAFIPELAEWNLLGFVLVFGGMLLFK